MNLIIKYKNILGKIQKVVYILYICIFIMFHKAIIQSDQLTIKSLT